MSNWEIYLCQSTIFENENINKSKFKYKSLQYSTSHKPQNGKIKVINLGKVVMLLLLPNDASFLTGEEQKCETAGPPLRGVRSSVRHSSNRQNRQFSPLNSVKSIKVKTLRKWTTFKTPKSYMGWDIGMRLTLILHSTKQWWNALGITP